MTASTTWTVRDVSRFGRAYWLPANGWGNGLEDESWAALVDVTREDAADLILRRLRHAGVPAYAAGVTRSGGPTHRARGDRHRFRIWVGSGSYGRGETTLLQLLPGLARRFGGEVLAP